MPNIVIDNTTLTFTNIWYVDPINGNNTTCVANDKSHPAKSVLYVAQYKASSTGDAIYALAGTHDVTYVSGSYGAGGLYDWNKNITFIGEFGKTIFAASGVTNTGRDHHAISCSGGSTVINIIFSCNFNNRGNIFSCAFFGRNGDYTKCTVHNSVFIGTDSSVISWLYDNSAASVNSLYNCLVITPSNMMGNYSGTMTKIQNTAFSKVIQTGGGANVTNLGNVTYDSSYRITSTGWEHTGTGTNPDGSVANIGIEGGPYAWVFNTAPTSSLNINKTTIHNDSVVLSGSITDANSDTVQYSVSLNGTIIKPMTTLASSPLTVNYTVPTTNMIIGTNTITVDYKDSKGASGVATFSVTRTNTNPTGGLNISTDNVSTGNSTLHYSDTGDVIVGPCRHAVSATITGSINDSDGDAVQYEILVNDKVQKVMTQLSSSPFSITNGSVYANLLGDNIVTVNMKDALGGTNSLSYVVVVTNNPPIVSSELSSYTIDINDPIMHYSISDPDGDGINYRILVNGIVKSDWQYDDTYVDCGEYGYFKYHTIDNVDMVIPHQWFSLGENTFTLEARDPYGATSSYTTTVTKVPVDNQIDVSSHAIVPYRKQIRSWALLPGPHKTIQSSAFIPSFSNKPSEASIPFFSIMDATFRVPYSDAIVDFSSSAYVLNEQSIYSQAIAEPTHKDFVSWVISPWESTLESSALINFYTIMDIGMSVIQPKPNHCILTCVKDTFTRQAKPKLNYGSFNSMVAGQALEGQYISYLEFDLSELYNYEKMISSYTMLKLTKSDTAKVTLNLYDYPVNFDEYYHCWWNSTPLSLTPFFTGEVEGSDIQIDITDYIQQLISEDKTVLRIAITTTDYVVISTRESSSPPTIDYVYTDPDWTNQILDNYDTQCQALVRKSLKTDISCSVRRFEHSNKQSSAIVKNGMECRADITNSFIVGTANIFKHSLLECQAIIRAYGEKDLTSRGDHNEAAKYSSAIVQQIKDVIGKASIRSPFISEEMVGTAWVVNSVVKGKASIYQWVQLTGDATVRKSLYKDINAQGSITNSIIPSRCDIWHTSSKYSQATIRHGYNSDINAEASVLNSIIRGKCDIFKAVDKYCSAHVAKPGFKDISSTVFINNSVLLSWFHLNHTNDIKCSAIRPLVKDVISHVIIRQEKYTQTISEALIQKSGERDYNSQADLFKGVSLPSEADVWPNMGIRSEAIIRQFDVQDIIGTAGVQGGWYKSLLSSTAIVRKYYDDLVCSAEVTSGARRWAPEREGGLIFDRALPRIWRRAEFIKD